MLSLEPPPPEAPLSPEAGLGTSGTGVTGVSAIIIGLGAGAFGLGACGRGAFRAAAFFLGAALLRAVFFLAVLFFAVFFLAVFFLAAFLFAAFFFGPDLRAALRVVLRAAFLRAAFLATFFRLALALDFTRAFLDFAAFFPARFFVAFLAAIVVPPVGLVCIRESQPARIQNSPAIFGKPDSRLQR